MSRTTRTATGATGRLCRYLLIACTLSLCAHVWAQNKGDNRERNNSAQQQDIGPGQAARIAQQRHGGKVLKVSRDGQSYHVKLLLPSGTVRTVRISASGN